ncbi:hypothetical protein [Agrobacterium tumefaciens]|uniref:hypothetical protein n=1 Tax=Agrobacterium tumefaciens TaxID=358 RepID=UPI0013AFCE5D|nr:hypothetical protein [Agrobacterium tumefaciens]MCP2132960.1 hypothetical protein [Rhizobium sp. SLBN-94]
MSGTKDERKPSGAGIKLMGFVVATLLWLLAAGYAIWNTKGALSDGSCASALPCLKPNEWGDLLAGIFAPIAFLWLVATVWIQSDELRLQREEMRESRNSLDAQVKESEQQARHLGEQTSLLREEATLRRADNSYVQFNALVETFVMDSYHAKNRIFLIAEGISYPAFAGEFVAYPLYISNLFDYLSGIRPDVINPWIDISHDGELITLIRFLYAAEELQDRIPFAQRLLWNTKKLKDVMDWYCDLIVVSPQLTSLLGHVEARKKRLNSIDDTEFIHPANL